MSEQPLTRRDLEVRLILKAWKDAAFAEALRADPKAAVERELGSELPANLTVTVVEETPTNLYLVIPPKPAEADGGALSDSDLDAVAGGAGGLMQLVAYGAQDPQ
jgi:hypothetical protein